MLSFKDLFPKKKVKKFSEYIPPFLKRTRSGAAADIPDASVNRTNTDLTDLRYGVSSKEVVRDFSKVSPDLSHVLNTLVRFIITDKYTVFANKLGEGSPIDQEATEAVQTLVTRIDKLPPNYEGFSFSTSFNGIAETLLFQMLCNGDMMAELILDKALLPSHVRPISTNGLKYEQKGDKAIPYIMQEGEKIFLDSPAIQRVSLNQDPESPYADSFFESAIQAILSSEEYRGDIRKAFRKASLPRVTAEIDLEKFKAGLTPDILLDSDKMATAMQTLISGIEDQLNGLNPEDCIVSFDTVKVQHLSQGNTSTHESLKVHSQIMNGLVSAGLKTLPSILGRGESQSVASTETVLMLKMVENLQSRLNELFSGLLTLSARLLGHDVVVSFKYAKPNLRPDIELEGFKAMEQSRVLEQLSLGIISDVEASIILTGDLPGPDFKPLSGTGFRDGTSEPIENPYSETSVTGKGVTSTKVQKDLNKDKTKPKTNRTTG